jgi:hypothetical protein
VRVRYALALDGEVAAGRFAPELSFGAPLDLRTVPEAPLWRFPIETVAKSERGLERTAQGTSVTPQWPEGLTSCSIELHPPPRS